MNEEKFIKRRLKWGLLCKPISKEGRWWFVDAARHLFDSELEAHQKASEYNIGNAGNYLYKPVEVWIAVEVDKRLK